MRLSLPPTAGWRKRMGIAPERFRPPGRRATIEIQAIQPAATAAGGSAWESNPPSIPKRHRTTVLKSEGNQPNPTLHSRQQQSDQGFRQSAFVAFYWGMRSVVAAECGRSVPQTPAEGPPHCQLRAEFLGGDPFEASDYSPSLIKALTFVYLTDQGGGH